MKYIPQEGDTTMDEALGLLSEAVELLAPISVIQQGNEAVDSFLSRAERFLADNEN